jgi:hypothetical protein
VIVRKDHVERIVAFVSALEAGGLQLQPVEMRMKIVVGKAARSAIELPKRGRAWQGNPATPGLVFFGFLRVVKNAVSSWLVGKG